MTCAKRNGFFILKSKYRLSRKLKKLLNLRTKARVFYETINHAVITNGLAKCIG